MGLVIKAQNDWRAASGCNASQLPSFVSFCCCCCCSVQCVIHRVRKKGATVFFAI